jgi:DNA-binding transcriptional LysR family regulator
MELRHLRYFVAVAEELNFTRAAERLGISQPPLSLQIRQLEKELGTPLFLRRARSVELTDAGRLLLEEARVILKQVETAKSGVRRRGPGETARIVVGSAGATYFHPVIPEIILEYGMRYPDIILAPQASNTSLLVARLRAGQVDIALIRPPIDDVEGLTIVPLINEDTVAILPNGHRLSKFASVPLAALAKEVFVLYPRALNPGNYDAVLAACRRAGFNPTLGQEAPQIVSVIPLVAAGFGVSIVPRSTARILPDEVCYRPIEADAPRAEISLALCRRGSSRAVQNFVAVARRVIRSEAESDSKDSSKKAARASARRR